MLPYVERGTHLTLPSRSANDGRDTVTPRRGVFFALCLLLPVEHCMQPMPSLEETNVRCGSNLSTLS
jgi:hypothetical protein